MIKYIIILMLILILISTSLLVSQTRKMTNGFGLSAGMISGTGLSYAHKFVDSQLKVTMGILAIQNPDECYTGNGEIFVYSDSSEVDTSYVWKQSCDTYHISFNMGIQYIRYLHRGKKSSLYLLSGLAFYYSSNKTENQKYKNVIIDNQHYTTEKVGDKYNSTDKNIRLNFGTGLGFEYQFTKNLSVYLEFPITFSESEEKFNVTMIIPQISIMYFF